MKDDVLCNPGEITLITYAQRADAHFQKPTKLFRALIKGLLEQFRIIKNRLLLFFGTLYFVTSVLYFMVE